MFLKENIPFRDILSGYKTPLVLFLLGKILEEVEDKTAALNELKRFKNKKLLPLFDSFRKSFKNTKNLKIKDSLDLSDFFYEFIDLVSLLCFQENGKLNKLFFKIELQKKCIYWCDNEKMSGRLSAFCFKFLIQKGVLDFYKEDGSNSHFLRVGSNFTSVFNLHFLNAEGLLPGRDDKKNNIINKLSKKSSDFSENSKKFEFLTYIELNEYAYNYEASEFLYEYLSMIEACFQKKDRPLFEFDKGLEDNLNDKCGKKFKLRNQSNKDKYKKYLDDTNKYNAYLKQVNDIVAIHNSCYVGYILKLLGINKFRLNRRIDSRGRMYSTGILSFEVGSVNRLLIVSKKFDYISVDSANYIKYKKHFYDVVKIKECEFENFYELYNKSKKDFFFSYFNSHHFNDDKWVTLSYILDFFSVLRSNTSNKIFYQDSSNSAYQMISGMTGNKKLAIASNVIFDEDNSFEKKDVYLSFLPELNKVMICLTRNDVKKQIMTTPYGVTFFGMIKKFEESGFSREDSIKATRCISKILNEKYPDINDLMVLLKDFFIVSLLFGEDDLVFVVDGLKISFVVYIVSKKKITIDGSRVTIQGRTDFVDFKKTCNSLTANLTHAYDSYFLSSLYFSALDGDRNVVISSIHDSFGSNFLDMDLVNDAAIEAFKLVFFSSNSFVDQINFKLKNKFFISKQEEDLANSIINKEIALDKRVTYGMFKNVNGWGKEKIKFLDNKNQEVVFVIDVKKLSDNELLLLKYYFTLKSRKTVEKFLENKNGMVDWKFKKIIY